MSKNQAVMKRYLYLNGKKLTKFDIASVCNDVVRWRFVNCDAFTYDELVWLLVKYCQELSARNLGKYLRFYYGYGSEPEIRTLFDEDVARYYR